jgi:hypothetical protein
MVRRERTAVDVRPMNNSLSELLGGPDLVARLAQAADVAIVVGAAARQRDDVVGDRRGGEDSPRQTVAAQRLRLQSSQALSYTASAAKAVRLRIPVSVLMLWLNHSRAVLIRRDAFMVLIDNNRGRLDAGQRDVRLDRE